MNPIFQHSSGPTNASILVIGEYPSTEEARKGKPFSSEAGLLFKDFMRMAGMEVKDALFVNLVNSFPSKGDMGEFFYTNEEVKKASGLTELRGLYPSVDIVSGRARLAELVDIVKPNFIIICGNYSLWAMLDQSESINIRNIKKVKRPTGILQWRGSHLYYHASTGRKIPMLPVIDSKELTRYTPYQFRTKMDLSVRYRKFKEDKWADFERTFIIRPSFEQVMTFLSTMISEGKRAHAKGEQFPIACDIETRANHIACVGFAPSEFTAICIPFLCVERDSYWSMEEELAIITMAITLMSHPGIKIIGQNFLFDCQFFAKYWFFRCPIGGDTMIAQHTLFPGSDLDLVTISSQFCDYHRYWKDDGKLWDKNVGEEQLWAYNCRDCVITYEAHIAQQFTLEYYKQTEQYAEGMDQLNCMLKMILRGVNIDEEVKHAMDYELEAIADEYGKRLEAYIPEDVYPRDPKKSPWYTSNVQLATVFQDYLGMKPYFNRKVRRYTVDDAALNHWGQQEPILFQLTQDLRAYRSLSTFQTFTKMKLDDDGRMRSSFSPTAETFRWRSSKNVFGLGGNLQNLPKGNEEEEELEIGS